MEPKLDTSVPKDQILALLLSVTIGLMVGLTCVRYFLGSAALTTLPIAYSIIGAFLGAFSIGFRNLRVSWRRLLLITAVVLLALSNLQIIREVVLTFLISWLGAFGVVSCYHFSKSMRA